MNDDEEIIIFIMDKNGNPHMYDEFGENEDSLRLENLEYLIDKMSIIYEELDDVKSELKKELNEVLW